MAWIESHQSLGLHPKVRRVADQLGVSRPTVVGHLHYLWWWALDFAQDGDLSRYSPAEIAEAAMWDGDADRFVRALLRAGFLDADPLRLHDWWEYAGRLIERRQRDAERKRLARRRTSNGHPPDVRGTSGRTVPNPTGPYPTQPYPTQPDPTQPDPTGPDLSSADDVPEGVEAVAQAPPERERVPRAVLISGEEPPPSVPSDAASGIPLPPPASYKPRLEDELRRSPQTRAEHSAWGNAIHELRTATPPVLPDELPHLIARYRSLWPDAVCTPMALAKHLGLLRSPPSSPNRTTPVRRAVDRDGLGNDVDYVQLYQQRKERERVQRDSSTLDSDPSGAGDSPAGA